MLTLKRDKTEILVSSKNGELKIEQLHYNGIFVEPKISCYLGIIIDNNLKFDKQLNKTFKKMANAIRSIYLKTSSTIKSKNQSFLNQFFVPSQFKCIFFQSLSVMSLQRFNRQINWGIRSVT